MYTNVQWACFSNLGYAEPVSNHSKNNIQPMFKECSMSLNMTRCICVPSAFAVVRRLCDDVCRFVILMMTGLKTGGWLRSNLTGCWKLVGLRMCGTAEGCGGDTLWSGRRPEMMVIPVGD